MAYKPVSQISFITLCSKDIKAWILSTFLIPVIFLFRNWSIHNILMESNIKILRHGFADNISDYHNLNFQLPNSIPPGAILIFIQKRLILHFDYVTLHNWLYHQNKNLFWKLLMYLNSKCLHKGDGLNSFRTVLISKIFLVNPHCPLKPCEVAYKSVPHFLDKVHHCWDIFDYHICFGILYVKRGDPGSKWCRQRAAGWRSQFCGGGGSPPAQYYNNFDLIVHVGLSAFYNNRCSLIFPGLWINQVKGVALYQGLMDR
jgi:hypothetical protein